MNKPWMNEEGGSALEGFIGARGAKTRLIRTSAELRQIAAAAFELPPACTCAEIAERVGQLPKRERRRLTEKNLDTAMATVLVRAQSPAGAAAPTAPKTASGTALTALAQDIGVDANHLADALRSLLEPSPPVVAGSSGQDNEAR